MNKVILIGNVGRDPEVRYGPSGDAIANVSICTTERWKDKNGNKQSRDEWHNLVFFGRLGEVVGEFVKKGYKLSVVGKNRTRKWEKDGVTRYTTEIHCDEMEIVVGGQRDGGQNNGQNDDGQNYNNNQSGYSNQNNSGNNQQANDGFGDSSNQQNTGQNNVGYDGFGGGGALDSDDIPFMIRSSSYALS